MNKRITAIILGIIMIIGLVACNGSKNEEPKVTAAPTPTESAKQVVTPEPTPEATPEVTEAPVIPENGKPRMLGALVGTEYLGHSEDYTSVVETQYDVLLLPREFESSYPELAAQLKDYSETRAGIAEQNDEWLYDIYKEDKEYLSESGMSLLYRDSAVVRRADTNVFSFVNYVNTYAGGAHDSYDYYGYNIDSKTGKLLTLSDICGDVEAFADAVIEKLHEKYTDTFFFSEDNEIKDMVINEMASWTLDYQCVSVYFNPYQVASFADGLLTVPVSFAEHRDLFEEKYLEIPEEYSFSLLSFQPIDYDFDSDGSIDRFVVYPAYDYHGEYTPYPEIEGINVELNGKTISSSFYALEFGSITIYHTDGKDFMYISTFAESDTNSTTIYRVTSDGVEYLDNIGSFGVAGEVYAVDDSTEYYCTKLYAPSDVRFQTIRQVLGTNLLYKHYAISSDGLPVAQSKYYESNGYDEYTMLVDLEVRSYDAESEKVSGIPDMTVAAGTEVKLLYTDGNRRVVLQTETGETFYVELDKNSEWYGTIDGVDIGEIFDGIIYAG